MSRKPKLKCLQHLGFSTTSITNLISANPNLLLRDIDNTIEFLCSVQLYDQDIIKVLRKCTWLLTPEIQKNVTYNIEILRQCGVPDKQITRSLLRLPRFFIQKPECIKCIVARADEFRIKRDSGSFFEAVKVMGGMRKASIDAKFELYKSYGWSELNIISAFTKFPNVLGYSDQNIRATMSLVAVGYKPMDVASGPRVFGSILEKVLKPRNEVLNILISRGFIKRRNFLLFQWL